MRRLATLLTLGLLLVTLFGGVTAGPESATAQGNNDAAKECRQGGYASKVRGEGPRKGEGFKNVGECVRYVATGGTLAGRSLGGSDPCVLARSYNPITQTPSLTSLNLGPCDLSNLDLSGANLSYSSVIGGYLPGANLTGANLTGTNLSGANLNSAILVNATLSGANLDNANLAYADLTGANLAGATLFGDVIWASTTCPDGTNSDDHDETCVGHL